MTVVYSVGGKLWSHLLRDEYVQYFPISLSLIPALSLIYLACLPFYGFKTLQAEQHFSNEETCLLSYLCSKYVFLSRCSD